MMLISWNTTNRCNLRCEHCYRDAGTKYEDELETSEGKRLLEEIAKAGFRLMVFSGGEPFMRDDCVELASYAANLGMRPVFGTNGTLLTEDLAGRLKEAGTSSVAISLHMLDEKRHDDFCGTKGAFRDSLRAMDNCAKVGLDFQVNTTVFERNYDEVLDICDLAIEKGAKSHHVLFLVPTGRGENIERESLREARYERLIRRLLEKRASTGFDIKPTCAPHFMRIAHAMKVDTGRYTRGCLAGISYISIIPNGDVWPCPYLPLKVGNVRDTPFSEIWKHSEILKKLRTQEYTGRCGDCRYAAICGGCRARAYFYSGDLMGEEPWCSYGKGAVKAREGKGKGGGK